MSAKAVITSFLLLAASLLPSCVPTSAYRQCDGATWGTTFHITYNADNDLCDSIHLIMSAVDASLSPFNDSSLISRINRGENVPADSMLRKIFLTSQAINRCSGGKFDPTVAPLVNLWGFGYKNFDSLPSPCMIADIMPAIGIDRCRLMPDGTIHKAHPLTEFNFSAITKGYGCDLIADMLRRNGCNDYMIEIGGEIAVNGISPRGTEWRIMIDAPVSSDSSVIHNRMAVISPGDCGIASSGNYRNYRETDRGRVWHTIDPSTGYPAVTSTLSATVIAGTTMEADALATACLAMTPDSALEMIERYDSASVLLVTCDSLTGQWQLHRSSRFPMIQK